MFSKRIEFYIIAVVERDQQRGMRTIGYHIKQLWEEDNTAVTPFGRALAIDDP